MGLENDTLAQLHVKRNILKEIIRMGEEEKDPRVREPKRQLVIIDAEIKRRQEKNEPEDLVVGLQTLNLKIDKG